MARMLLFGRGDSPAMLHAYGNPRQFSAFALLELIFLKIKHEHEMWLIYVLLDDSFEHA